MSKLTGEVAADPGVARAHLTLAWDEAQRGCTRVVEVDGRLEWLDIPAGAGDGQEICFPGRGKSVPDDSRHGDLWVTVEVLPEPVAGETVSAELEVSPVEALTGARKTVQLENRVVWVRVPPNVANGDILTITGEGAEGENGGTRGDLRVTLRVLDTLPIPIPDFEPALAVARPKSVVRYEPPPPPPARKGSALWVAAVLVSGLIGAGATWFVTSQGSEAPAVLPAQVLPSPPLPPVVAPPVREARPSTESRRPAPTPELKKASSTPAPVRKPAPAARPRPIRKPRRVVRAVAPAPPRPKPRATARPAAARARFCGRCGRRISSGSFCGNCGRKV